VAGSSPPKIGEIYYMIQYEDAKLTRPIVSSFKYVGLTDGGSHFFSMLGLGEVNIFLDGKDVASMLELPAMISELASHNPTAFDQARAS
jgi:hypothetical protein